MVLVLPLPAECSLGVVLLRDGSAPDGHHRVADELLDGAAVQAHEALAGLEVARQQLARVLRVALLRERGEPDEVGEEDRDEPPLDGVRLMRGDRHYFFTRARTRRPDFSLFSN